MKRITQTGAIPACDFVLAYFKLHHLPSTRKDDGPALSRRSPHGTNSTGLGGDDENCLNRRAINTAAHEASFVGLAASPNRAHIGGMVRDRILIKPGGWEVFLVRDGKKILVAFAGSEAQAKRYARQAETKYGLKKTTRKKRKRY